MRKINHHFFDSINFHSLVDLHVPSVILSSRRQGYGGRRRKRGPSLLLIFYGVTHAITIKQICINLNN